MPRFLSFDGNVRKLGFKLNGDSLSDNGQNNGTASNITWGDGLRYGKKAAYFNGTDSGISLSQIPMFVQNTFSCWVKAENDEGTAIYRVFSNWSSNDSQTRICFYINTDGFFIFWWNGYALTSSFNLKDDKWHHICVVREYRLQRIRYYVDGERKHDWSANVSDLTMSTIPSIGIDPGGTHPFKGAIADLFVTDKVISGDDVKNIYEKGRKDFFCFDLDFLNGNFHDRNALFKTYWGNSAVYYSSVGGYYGLYYSGTRTTLDWTYSLSSFDYPKSEDNITFSCWVYRTGYSGYDNHFSCVFSNTADFSSSLYNFLLGIDTTQYNPNPLFFFYFAGVDGSTGNFSISSSTVCALSQWYCVTCTLDQKNKIAKIYVNGLKENETTFEHPIFPGYGFAQFGQWYRQLISKTWYRQYSYGGYIRKCRIIKKVLSEAEVLESYNNEL